VLRSQSLRVVVFCPHFQRSVNASRNLAIDRLVSCEESERCRAPAPGGGQGQGHGLDQGHEDGHEHARLYPHGCPVFPSLAK
jgi:hypothetical protein